MEVVGSDFWNAHCVAAACTKALGSNGIQIDLVTDPDEIAASLSGMRNAFISPWLDPACNDFTSDNYFWLVGSRDGEPLLVGGGRLDVVGNLGRAFIRNKFNLAYGPGTVCDVRLRVARELRGRVCYLGDLQSKAGSGLSRLNRQYYLGVANFISATHFRADSTYSFMRVLDVERGSADINGFDQRISKPVVWGNIPSSRSMEELIVFRDSINNTIYFQNLKRVLELRELKLSDDPQHPQLKAQA
jgi:hypothetical protein